MLRLPGELDEQGVGKAQRTALDYSLYACSAEPFSLQIPPKGEEVFIPLLLL